MFPLTRVPFWRRVFEPQPYLFHGAVAHEGVFRGICSEAESRAGGPEAVRGQPPVLRLRGAGCDLGLTQAGDLPLRDLAERRLVLCVVGLGGWMGGRGGGVAMGFEGATP